LAFTLQLRLRIIPGIPALFQGSSSLLSPVKSWWLQVVVAVVVVPPLWMKNGLIRRPADSSVIPHCRHTPNSTNTFESRETNQKMRKQSDEYFLDGWMDGWCGRRLFITLRNNFFVFLFFLMMSQLRNGLYTSEIFKIK
jgi:hypothetical protein